MTYIFENWYLIIAFISIGASIGCVTYKFFRLPTDKQLKKVKEWLLYAVIVAENKFGEKTGQLKLRAVYDMFVVKFPSLAKIMSFEVFSSLVDEALLRMNELLSSNESIKNLVYTPESSIRKGI